MNEGIQKYYFSIIKFSSLLTLIYIYLTQEKDYLQTAGLQVLLLAVFMAAAVFAELTDDRKKILVTAEILLFITFFLVDRRYGIFLFPVVLFDVISCFGISFWLSLLGFAGIAAGEGNEVIYLILYGAYLVIQFQRIFIINNYQKYVKNFEDTENNLKTSIDNKENYFKRELENNNLYFENKMLEEKSRLSQALHDKLGHNINGSIYQLEAAKLLADKQPEESKRITQAVIDSLRGSMHEIRILLRKEKPDKKKMAFVQLQGLCKDCRTKYGIHMDVKVNGENDAVPEVIWEVILDNSFEAVSNALKYAGCTEIKITIQIMAQVVRCTIVDNGTGSGQINEGMGISGMKRRVRQVNGIIDFEHACGFKINMIIPF